MSLIRFTDPFEHEDLFYPTLPREFHPLLRYPGGYLRPWRSAASGRDSGSTVSCNKDGFQVNLDVQHFKPEEITVKASDNTITVEGKHEEKEDEHGVVSRHFLRRYVLPKGHDAAKIESKLSSDGVLSITAPKTSSAEEEHRSIPVIQTGQPSKAVEEKKKE